MKTRLREMTVQDVPAVIGLVAEQNLRDGTSYGLPEIFLEDGRRNPRIVLALVAVDEREKVQQCHIWIKTLEQMSFGINPRATVSSADEQAAFLFLLREKGYEDFHTFLPVERVEQMRHWLERRYGLSQTGLAHFYRVIDTEENFAVQRYYEEARNVPSTAE